MLRPVGCPVVTRTELNGMVSKSAILFCDNWSAHCSEDVLKKLARHGTLVIIYPPHTSHLFQVLDVLLFFAGYIAVVSW
jgi:hypothetical protein